MVTYFDRLNAGLQQLMAGARKFKLNYISRDDLFALTREASEVSGISYVMDSDREEVDNILGKSPNNRKRKNHSKTQSGNVDTVGKPQFLMSE
jgi:hypothetical protein